MSNIDFSVVVPVYNSERTLEELYNRLKATFDNMGKSFEVIFVNDCSSDNSLEVLRRIHDKNDKVVVADLFKNYGQQNALMCGFNFCSGEYIITIDDDLQNPPEEIPALFDKLKEGYDAVFGAYREKKDKAYKNLGSLFIRKINHKVFNINNGLKFSSYRIIRSEIIEQLKVQKTPFPYISGMIMSITNKVTNVYISH